jgi:hypothetical protein
MLNQEPTPKSLFSLQKFIFILFAIIIPWQFYFEFYDRIDLPLSFFVVCTGCAFTAFMRPDWITTFRKLKWILSGYGLMLAAIGVSSILRSSDNLYEAANVLGHLGVGLIVIMWVGLILHLKKDGLFSKTKLLQAFLISLLPLGVVGIVLFMNPGLEQAWLNTISGVLIEADSATTVNNISAIDRIGVVFMDVNTGSVFWGISMWLALWMRQNTLGFRRILNTALATVYCINLLATGSRAGILALILSSATFLIIHVCYTKKYRESLINAAIIISVVFSLILLERADMKPEVLNNSIARAKSLAAQSLPEPDRDRLALLSHSVNAIMHAPFLGYGVINFEKLSFPKGYPPQNMFLQAWIFGGISAIAGLILLFSNVLYVSLKHLKKDQDMWLPIVITLWVIIQAMFTNFMIGNFRVAMLFWLSVMLFLLPRRHTIGEKR